MSGSRGSSLHPHPSEQNSPSPDLYSILVKRDSSSLYSLVLSLCHYFFSIISLPIQILHYPPDLCLHSEGSGILLLLLNWTLNIDSINFFCCSSELSWILLFCLLFFIFFYLEEFWKFETLGSENSKKGAKIFHFYQFFKLFYLLKINFLRNFILSWCNSIDSSLSPSSYSRILFAGLIGRGASGASIQHLLLFKLIESHRLTWNIL